VFITFFAGFIAVGAALWLEIAYQPPYWVHALVSLPIILITCLVPLRPLKGWLIARQFQMDAPPRCATTMYPSGTRRLSMMKRVLTIALIAGGVCNAASALAHGKCSAWPGRKS
jgi:hypothetical protein